MIDANAQLADDGLGECVVIVLLGAVRVRRRQLTLRDLEVLRLLVEALFWLHDGVSRVEDAVHGVVAGGDCRVRPRRVRGPSGRNVVDGDVDLLRRVELESGHELARALITDVHGLGVDRERFSDQRRAWLERDRAKSDISSHGRPSVACALAPTPGVVSPSIRPAPLSCSRSSGGPTRAARAL